MDFTYMQTSTFCKKSKEQSPIVEIINLKKNQHWSITTKEDGLIFILKGKLSSNYYTTTIESVSKGKILLLSSGYQFKSYAESDTKILIFRLRIHFQLCDCLLHKKLFNRYLYNNIEVPTKRTYLNIKPEVWIYLNSLLFSVEEGFDCLYFYEAKLKELYYYINKYYNEEEIYIFFLPLLYYDARFHDFVLSNHDRVKNVKELAEVMNYSISGFEKHFKRVFGISPGKWMLIMRSEAIERDIKYTLKSFKQISEDFGFYSPSHFNNFCKKQFGHTPGKLRNCNI